MDPLIPIIVLTSIIGIYRVIPHLEKVWFLIGSFVYLVFVFILTILVMLPYAHEPNNNPALFYLYSLTTEYYVPALAVILGFFLTIGVFITMKRPQGPTLLIISLIFFTLISSIPIVFWDAKIAAKTGSLLPFCEDVNTLCADSGIVFWDTSSESEDWDRIVYYTLKFWLGDRVVEMKNESLSLSAGKERWLITKKPGGEPVISYSQFRVIPFHQL